MINIRDFNNIDIRAGTVTKAEYFPEAGKPAYKLFIDFGPLGKKQSSAQITDLYEPEDLLARQVLAVVNFPSKRITGFKSIVLVLGACPEHRPVVLLKPDTPIPNGTRIG